MNVDTTDVPKLSILDQLKMQNSQFVAQRDSTQTNLNQLIGAIYACELMIKKHEEEDSEKSKEIQDDISQQELDILQPDIIV